MRTIRLLARIPAGDPRAALSRIAEFDRFPALADDVRAVEVHPAVVPGGPRDSDWAVTFRRGVLRWNEWELVDPDRCRIEFRQTAGDFADFSGRWQLTPGADGCDVLFTVTYDFGVESLAGIMDPIAERVVTRVACSVLAGLFGECTVLEGGSVLTDLTDLTDLTGLGS